MPEEMTPAALSAHLYKEYRSGDRLQWLEELTTDRDFFLNKQWTNEEVGILNERDQAALTINRIFPIVQQKLAQLSIHQPNIAVLPREEGDLEKAGVWSHVIDYVLQNSDFPLQDLKVKRDHIVAGVGYYYCYIDPHADDGKGEVLVKHLKPEVVFVDPNSEEPDFSDADHIIVSRKMTVRQATNLFPDKESELEGAAGQVLDSDHPDSGRSSGEGVITRGAAVQKTYDEKGRPQVRIIERFTKTRMIYYLVHSDEIGEQLIVEEKEWKASFKDNPQYETIEIYRTVVEKNVSAGEDTQLASEILPIEHYPVIPVPNVYMDTPFPASDVRFMRGIQEEINKRRSLMIYSATHSSTPKIMFEKGTVTHENLDQQWHKVGGRIEYESGTTGNAPTVVQPIPLPNAFFQLEQEAKGDLDFVAGVFPLSHGDPNTAPDTLGATLALEDFANRRLQSSLEMLSHAKRILGIVIIRLAKELYTLPKYMRVMGDNGKDQGKWVNDPNENTVLETDVDFDVIIQGGKQSPLTRHGMEQRMVGLWEKQAIDRRTLLENIDLPIGDKEEILGRMDEVQNMASQIEALQEQIKDLEGINQTLQRGQVQASMKSIIDEHRNMERAKYLETKAEYETLQKEFKLLLQDAKRDIQFALKQAREGENARTPEPETGTKPQPPGDGKSATEEK